MPAYLGYDVLGAFELGNANMTPTSLRAVAADLATAIRNVTPSYPLFQDHPWTPVARVLDVPGSLLRLYCCEWDPPEPVEDGIWGDDAMEHITSLRVVTNYRGLPEIDDEFQDVHAEIVSADGNDLHIALLDQQDPVTSGLINVTRLGWDWLVDEPGHAYGEHLFEVRILLAH